MFVCTSYFYCLGNVRLVMGSLFNRFRFIILGSICEVHRLVVTSELDGCVTSFSMYFLFGERIIQLIWTCSNLTENDESFLCKI